MSDYIRKKTKSVEVKDGVTVKRISKTNRRGTVTKNVVRKNGKVDSKSVRKESGTRAPGDTKKTVIKTLYRDGTVGKVKSKNTLSMKTPKDGKGSTYTDKYKKEDSSGKFKSKIKEFSGKKSKGNATYVSQKIKSMGKTTRHGSYVGKGEGKRKDVSKGY